MNRGKVKVLAGGIDAQALLGRPALCLYQSIFFLEFKLDDFLSIQPCHAPVDHQFGNVGLIEVDESLAVAQVVHFQDLDVDFLVEDELGEIGAAQIAHRGIGGVGGDGDPGGFHPGDSNRVDESLGNLEMEPIAIEHFDHFPGDFRLVGRRRLRLVGIGPVGVDGRVEDLAILISDPSRHGEDEDENHSEKAANFFEKAHRIDRDLLSLIDLS